MMNSKLIMSMAINTANETMCKGFGGPFGAAVVDSEGHIIATGSNTVLKDHDPTAHGEINAIRNACKKLGTHDLTGYILYTTAYPCPMCMSAIMWANIKQVYYGCTAEDTGNIGFRDDFMYNFIENKTYKDANELLTLVPVERESCLKLFDKYVKLNPTLY